MASADTAEALADAALAVPVNGMIKTAGPERAPLAEFVGTWLGETDNDRPRWWLRTGHFDGYLAPSQGLIIRFVHLVLARELD